MAPIALTLFICTFIQERLCEVLGRSVCGVSCRDGLALKCQLLSCASQYMSGPVWQNRWDVCIAGARRSSAKGLLHLSCLWRGMYYVIQVTSAQIVHDHRPVLCSAQNDLVILATSRHHWTLRQACSLMSIDSPFGVDCFRHHPTGGVAPMRSTDSDPQRPMRLGLIRPASYECCGMERLPFCGGRSSRKKPAPTPRPRASTTWWRSQPVDVLGDEISMRRWCRNSC